MRIVVSIVLVIHGLIHLLGCAKAFGLAELPQLSTPISRPFGLAWAAAGLLMIVAALVPWRAFWPIALVAVIASQIVIVTAWSDAKVGTAGNVIALVAAVYAFAAYGPPSFRAAFAGDASREVLRARPPLAGDLGRLPGPVQRYLSVTGAASQPLPTHVRARWRGRIRGSESDPWMEFTADQVSTFGASPSRLFLMDATMKRLPVAVYHRFVGDHATFRVRLLSLVSITDAKGPEMDHSETVTLFNDLCALVPGMLADPAIAWEPIDATHARATYTRGKETISAELVFDASGMLVDFISDDRSRASPDGTAFTRLRWTTPLGAPRAFGAVRLSSHGEARWHDGDHDYAYVEMDLLDVHYGARAGDHPTSGSR